MFEKISKISVASMLVLFLFVDVLPQHVTGCSMDMVEMNEGMKGESDKEGKDSKGSRDIDEYVSQCFMPEPVDPAAKFHISAKFRAGYSVPVLEGPFLPPEFT
jgi:hypothetical protein